MYKIRRFGDHRTRVFFVWWPRTFRARDCSVTIWLTYVEVIEEWSIGNGWGYRWEIIAVKEWGTKDSPEFAKMRPEGTYAKDGAV